MICTGAVRAHFSILNIFHFQYIIDDFAKGFRADRVWGVTATPFNAMERILGRIGHSNLVIPWRSASSKRPVLQPGTYGHAFAAQLSKWAHNMKIFHDSTIPKIKAVMIRHTKDMVIAGARALELPDMPCSTLLLDMTPAEEKVYRSVASGKDFGVAGWKRMITNKSASPSAIDLHLAHVRKATCVNTKLKAFSKDFKSLLRRNPSAHVVIFTRFQGSIDTLERFMSDPKNGLNHVEFMSISSKAKVTDRHTAIRKFQIAADQHTASSGNRHDADFNSDASSSYSDSEGDGVSAATASGTPSTLSARDVLLNYYTRGQERGLGIKIVETKDSITKLKRISLGYPALEGHVAEDMSAAEAAARASLKTGDILVGIDGTLVSSFSGILALIEAKVAAHPNLRKIPMVLNIQSNAAKPAAVTKPSNTEPKESEQNRNKKKSKMSGKSKAKKQSRTMQPAPTPKCLVVSYRTGQCGITLTAASCVYLLEPPVLLRDRIQAGGRIHRLGQDKMVSLKVLAMKKTVDEVICTFHSDLEADRIKMSQGGRVPEEVVDKLVHTNHPDPAKVKRQNYVPKKPAFMSSKRNWNYVGHYFDSYGADY